MADDTNDSIFEVGSTFDEASTEQSSSEPPKLISTKKNIDMDKLKRVDAAAEQHGYQTRKQTRKPGRPKSIYTGQLHLRVLPSSQEWFVQEAIRLEVQNGALMRRLIEAYMKQNPDAAEMPTIPTP